MSPSAVCEASPDSQGLVNGHNGNGSLMAIKPSNGTISLAESLAGLQTEQKNSKTTNIDSMSSLELCRVINEEDASVAQAVQTCLPQIANAIDIIVPRLLKGGRVIYTGAGTSGRLGVLDASEIPPTFSAPPGQFVGLIAGGDYAIRNAVEGAEDSEELGATDLAELTPPLNKNDTLMVDLKMSNEKLQNRARRVARMVVPPSSALDIENEEVLDTVLADCDGQVKLSILVATLGCSPAEGRAKLEAASGSLRQALQGNLAN
ncbi:hypothetical protein CEP52_004236 [Fusarium oligoseptatum]|uniref:SIS domain-containing protein n=1 Tax=Fusarium oligoseptatum TaxID=2604345 RepID=A0A428U491_9HYPO|nr:hypothetical protein CEP52_004236 [Fusarium oligoseptatum]